MLNLRRSNERGQTKIGWLDSRHSFSFNRYFDPRHMGFQHLRVINEDWVKPDTGFGTHPHNDMEIVTFVLKGTLAHKDSTGGVGYIHAGEVQHMTAGTGIEHSEFNESQDETVHLFQIWLLPERRGLEPGYEQRKFSTIDRTDNLLLVAARDGRNNALTIHQDVDIYVSSLTEGKELSHRLCPTRHAWVQVATGKLKVNGVDLETGDGLAVSDLENLSFQALENSEFMLFDLATMR